MKTSKKGLELIFILFAGMVALFAPVILKTKSLSYIIAPHAFLIVIGGTICAICISFSIKELMSAFCSLKSLFVFENKDMTLLADDILELAKIARAKGLLALNEVIDYIQNPFLKKAASSLVEDDDPKTLEENLRLMCFYENKDDFKNVEIFEEMGGYAPTFGMIGAVMGLIQISAVSSDPKALLGGIATAFIGTVYRVGSANLIFLPIAKKLKNNLNEKLLEQEIIISSILDIANMQSSVIISEKLNKIINANTISEGKVIPFAA